ncbi:MAG TPA: hypothetical protein DEA26_10520 [Oceanospirillales bacterium]|nr:hypothetical protein [Oceanospirillaceae bacterium]HBS43105.1 hypothetical protein [Oceanospirillales bacterium]
MTDISPTPEQTPPPGRDKDSREKDSRDIVTAYAFEVDKQLLGKPIARPWRRAVAQGIDLLFIAILSQLPSLLLALLTSFAFLRASRRNNHNIQSTLARRLLKFAGTVLLFITTVIIVEAIRDDEPSGDTENPVAQAVVYGLHTVARNQCSGDFECLSGVADGSGEAFAEAGVRRDDAEDHFNDFSDEPTLSDEQQAVLLTRYMAAFDQAAALQAATPDTPSVFLSNTPPDSADTSSAAAQPGCNCADSTYLTLKWLQELIAGLGQGIGWAALYHSVFIAWFRGRTPGKKLLRIRVVKLDGSDFSLWDSFGRYGGYGAGFATGLLGFVQVFWDANRQAIQDKIAETVVIYEK